MKINEVNKIIEAFYNGESSFKQEKELYEFFLNNDIPELKDERRIFIQLHEDKNLNIPINISSDISRLITGLETKEKKVNKRKIIFSVTGIAASILLLISIGVGIYREQNKKIINNDTEFWSSINNEDSLRIREAQEALISISYTFTEGIDHISKMINEDGLREDSDSNIE